MSFLTASEKDAVLGFHSSTLCPRCTPFATKCLIRNIFFFASLVFFGGPPPFFSGGPWHKLSTFGRKLAQGPPKQAFGPEGAKRLQGARRAHQGLKGDLSPSGKMCPRGAHPPMSGMSPPLGTRRVLPLRALWAREWDVSPSGWERYCPWQPWGSFHISLAGAGKLFRIPPQGGGMRTKAPFGGHVAHCPRRGPLAPFCHRPEGAARGPGGKAQAR
jgi:hypothetical protein